MLIWFIRVLLLTLICESAFGKGRINNGYEVDIEQAPYMARVRTGIGACDGSILSELYILTAGHCKF